MSSGWIASQQEEVLSGDRGRVLPSDAAPPTTGAPARALLIEQLVSGGALPTGLDCTTAAIILRCALTRHAICRRPEPGAARNLRLPHRAARDEPLEKAAGEVFETASLLCPLQLW